MKRKSFVFFISHTPLGAVLHFKNKAAPPLQQDSPNLIKLEIIVSWKRGGGQWILRT